MGNVSAAALMEADLVRRVQRRIEEEGVRVPPWRATGAERDEFRRSVARILAQMPDIPEGQLLDLANRVSAWICGLGPLEPLLSEPGVEEVMVRNGYVMVEREGEVFAVGHLGDDELFTNIATRAADLSGRAMWGVRPYALVDLPNGNRFSAMIAPLSVNGTAINVRVFRKGMSLEELERRGVFDRVDRPAEQFPGLSGLPEGRRVLDSLVWVVKERRASILISGQFSSGKTTLLNALLQALSPTTVVAIVETFRELQPPPHLHPLWAVVPDVLEGDSGLPPMREVVSVLYTRMRPDVIVFGEVVGDEAVPLLQAMNLGKLVYTTIHASDCYTALLRLEMLAMASGLPLPAVRERVARGVNLVLHLDRVGSRRFLRQVALVEGYDHNSERYILRVLYDGAPWMSARVNDLAEVFQC